MKKRLLRRFAMAVKSLQARRKLLLVCVSGLIFLSIHGISGINGYVIAMEKRGQVTLTPQTNRRSLLVSAEAVSMPNRTRKVTSDEITVNKDICDNSSDVFLIFLINSAPGNIKRRQRIRRSWGSIRNYRGYDVRYAFFLGGMDAHTHATVLNESKMNDDIVHSESYKDDYLNMTRKTLMAMGWVREHCSSASFVVKCDDDAMVNPMNLLEYLLNLRVEQSLRLYAGWREREGAHKFGKDSKWFVPPQEWPTDLNYPAYIRGYFVVQSMHVVRKLHQVSYGIKDKYNVSQSAHIDDVYVGLLAKDLGFAAEWLPHLFLGNPPNTDNCQMWGIIATLFNVEEDSKYDWYWKEMTSFDPVKHKCVELRKLKFSAGL